MPLKLALTAVTDARTHRAHLVTDDASAAGRPSGRYKALCGAIVLAASLTTPDRGQCDTCTHRAAPPPAAAGRGRHRRVSTRWSRLWPGGRWARTS